MKKHQQQQQQHHHHHHHHHQRPAVVHRRMANLTYCSILPSRPRAPSGCTFLVDGCVGCTCSRILDVLHGLSGRFFSTTEQPQPGKVPRPKLCPHCAADTGGFRNLGRCRGDRHERSWLCKTCKRRFTLAGDGEVMPAAGSGGRGVCFDFQRGACARGGSCRFRHAEDKGIA